MYVGIDPGVNGAMSLLDPKGRLVAAIDMPCAMVAKKQQPSAILISLQLREWGAKGAFIERVSGGIARPSGGKKSQPPAALAARAAGMFNFGEGAGLVRGVCIGLGLAVWRVPPAVWKKKMGVTADKETSRALALELWPELASLFRYKTNENRAESALIGRYGFIHLLSKSPEQDE